MKPYYPPPNLPDFRKFMQAVGMEEKPIKHVTEEPPAMMFVAYTESGEEVTGIFLEDHIERVGFWIGQADGWQRKYNSLGDCALLMMAGMFALVAIVGWLW